MLQIPDPDLSIRFATYMALYTIKVNWVIGNPVICQSSVFDDAAAS